MSQLNTIALRDALIGRVTDFALDDHFVQDEKLRAALRKIWLGRPETGGLGSDLWVEGAFPSTAANETMGDLVKRGLVRAELGAQLNTTGVFPSSLSPYQHQLESIEAAASRDYPDDGRPAIVVTAGTGAGKTESFLIPMLNELWGVTKQPTGGISALILYPMNALVNDQVGRLDKWLANQNQLSFFHFTSETPENANIANNRGLRKATAARFRTRQQARGYENRDGDVLPSGGGPNPDILVTNYSMLEYMLCRPQDGVFFGSNLRVVILDEAHIYSGNLAAEITLLLRRVLMRCGRQPEEVLFIATSATIGGGVEELKPFAAKLFSKAEGLVRVIVGRTQCLPLDAKPVDLPLPTTMATTLGGTDFPDEEMLTNGADGPGFRAATESAWRQWKSLLPALVPKAALTKAIAADEGQCNAAPLLARSLTQSSAISALQGILWNDGQPGRIPLRDLANQLFSECGDTAIEATRRLLQMGAVARRDPGALPLLPNRMHYLLRGPEGLLIAFEGEAAEAMEEIGEGKRVFSSGADPAFLDSGAVHPLTVFRCHESGWWGVAGRQTNGVLEPVPLSTVLYGEDESPEVDPENPNAPQPGRTRFFSLEEVPGRQVIKFEPSTGVYGSNGSVTLWEVDECPLSGAAFSPDTVGWFAARARLQLSVVAETALAAMPESPDENRVWKPARGRRLLVFSDSRAEAARLGPRLTRQHELQVFRAAVVERLSNVNLAGTNEERAVLEQQISNLRQMIHGAAEALRIPLQAQIDLLQNHLQQMGEGGSVADWSKVLRDSEIVRELYDAQGGRNHQPGGANVHDIWNANTNAILGSLSSLLGRELARRPAWPNPSLETLGLVEVTYPGIGLIPAPNELIGLLPATVAEKLEQIWPDYLAALLDAIRNQGAITLGSEDEDRDYQYGNGFLGKKFSAEDPYRRSMLPLIGDHFDGPQASRRNAFTRNVLLAIGIPEGQATDLARTLMRTAFEALCETARNGGHRWLKFIADAPTNGDNIVAALQIQFCHLGLRRPTTLYQCSRTGQIWSRSVVGFYPGAPTASLEQIPSEDVDKDARIGRRRRELLDWSGFKLGLWAEEHSAQLSPEENARLQNLFREGMRNILSSTTTLELGIDIGGLSAVLLGNLPPGKANYLQRAGRAGRRADGTSAVLGFARPSAYEREVFLNFRHYLDRELRRPTVFLDRAPLVRRHAHAWLLGEFFRTHFLQSTATGAMDAYGRIGVFAGEPIPDLWKKNASSKPTLPSAVANSMAGQFLDYLSNMRQSRTSSSVMSLQRLWTGCPNVQAHESAWEGNMEAIRQEFEKAITNWQSLYLELLEAWNAVSTAAGPSENIGYLRAQANSIYFQLHTLHRLTVIEALADARFLPRYGFPIGLSRLRVQVPDGNNRTREEDQFRLQRDGMMAMREYAPGSQLLVGGQIVTSRGLLKHWTGAVVQNQAWGLRGRFKKSGDGYFSYSLTAAAPQAPPAVAPGQNVQEGFFLFPKHGFTTAAWDPPRFGSDFERIGKLSIFTLAFENAAECDPPQSGFGGINGLVATYRNAGELFLMNSGANDLGFAICQKCGYAESEWKRGAAGRVDLPKRFEWHAPLNATNPSFRCWTADEAPAWRNHHLAAKQTTHLLRLDFAGLGQPLDRDLLYTLGQSLRITAAKALEQDERQIGLIDPVPDPLTGNYRCVILFDTLAGGSGHLAELSHPDNAAQARDWLVMMKDLLTVEGDMPDPVRRREATRRLLTADCDDSRLDPTRALTLIGAVSPGNQGARQVPPIAPIIPPDAWTVQRLVDEVPPEQFNLFCGPNEIAGLAEGVHTFRWLDAPPSNGVPPANAIVVARLAGNPAEIVLGKWFYTRVDRPDHPHRIRLRRIQNAVTQELSDDEFAQFRILAVKAQ
jgi:DEAD/DEAH box helicase domain-containing protein